MKNLPEVDAEGLRFSGQRALNRRDRLVYAEVGDHLDEEWPRLARDLKGSRARRRGRGLRGIRSLRRGDRGLGRPSKGSPTPRARSPRGSQRRRGGANAGPRCPPGLPGGAGRGRPRPTSQRGWLCRCAPRTRLHHRSRSDDTASPRPDSCARCIRVARRSSLERGSIRCVPDGRGHRERPRRPPTDPDLSSREACPRRDAG